MTMIAGGGFARMAADLASRRAEASGEWSICTVESGGPVSREDIGCRADYPASFEYYRIIDSAHRWFHRSPVIVVHGKRLASVVSL